MNVLKGGRDLEMYAEEIAPFSDVAESWGDCSTAGWRLDEETGELYGHFPRGTLNLRIDYRAGFSAVPQAVQEACTQLTQDLYQASLVNSTLKKATLGPSSVELKDNNGPTQFSPKVQLLLTPYRDYAKVIFR